ncbi:GDSL-type esterase/lipase family protein [Evansella sp. LMS18]|uniref:GDSL-type esterase/lipase family protein n=1 Tax=Evansella sp. LMS18 TaxID=2924033 RepID=UPI0020D0CACD|nr:GDSL-type esterase/lipase family protein [Evansella sp. LMS18]UTR12343.1 GDSL-type esterase/lipase family protein [Evansella sp. LMS18]
MRCIFKTFILMLIVSLFFATDAFAKSDQAKNSLVALGDSIPFGYNLGENNNAAPYREAYPYIVGKEADMRVRNLGVPGWRTDQLLTALETDQKFRQAVRHADYITLSIGNNDLLQALAKAQQLSGGNSELFLYHLKEQIENINVYDNLDAIVGKVRSLTSAPIVFYNIYNPFQTYDPLHSVGNLVLSEINPMLDAQALSLNRRYGDVAVVDAFTAFGNNQAEYVIAGDIHPTLAGQRVLAEAGLQALSSFR